MEFILAFVQKCFHLPFPTPEHVLCMPKVCPIQIHIRNRIEPIANEGDSLFAKQVGIDGETVPIFPIVFGYPHHLEFVIRYKRVGELTQRQQIGMYTTWDRRGRRFIGSTLAKLPFAVQTLLLHCYSSSLRVYWFAFCCGNS